MANTWNSMKYSKAPQPIRRHWRYRLPAAELP
jgi:hypothetical protein